MISATDVADQNTENIRIVANILNQTATLLSDSNTLIILSPSEVSMVCTLLKDNLLWCSVKTTESTIQTLDNIEEWPPSIIGTQSNE